MNTLELSNVELSADLQAELVERKNRGDTHEAFVNSTIDPVIQRLATLNPLWRFIANSWGYGGGNRLALTSFSVLEHGEELGKISRELKPNERIEKAMENAEKVMSHQKRLKEREKYSAESTIKTAAHTFIMGTGFPLFLEHIKTGAEHERNKIMMAMEEDKRLADEMMTIEKAKAEFEAGKTALVIKDGGKYLVKIGDKIDLFDDNTLPDWMRGKLGMLKLVQAEAFISDTGCRVNDETFVLIVEET